MRLWELQSIDLENYEERNICAEQKGRSLNN